MKLNEKISLPRKQKKLSQTELAEQTGISRDAIGKYERGDIVPSVEYAKKIAEVWGLSLDFLVSNEDKEEALDHKAVLRIKELEKLQEMERDKIYSVIDA